MLDERPVAIHRLALVETPDRDHAVFEAECGKGTYVRSLARDIGRQLGCLGHVVALRRLVVGPFDEATFVTLAELEARKETGGEDALDALLRPVGFVLADLPELVLSTSDAARLRRGQSVIIRGRDAPASAPTAHATSAGESIAIGEIAQGEFPPRRVFRQ